MLIRSPAKNKSNPLLATVSPLAGVGMPVMIFWDVGSLVEFEDEAAADNPRDYNLTNRLQQEV